MQFPFSAIKRLGTGLIAASLVASPVFAADSAIDSGDTAWILTATALVLLMTLPGLALFYAGLVQSKNIVSVLMHHFAIAALMSVLWVIAGYSLAFSGDGAWVGDLANSFMSKITLDSASGTIPESVFAAFQMTFAIITPALIIGAYVERMKFAAILLFSAVWLLTVYAPVTHWVWGGGIMAEWGVLDFAGGIVVHATAGTAALVCALVVGKRRSFPTSVQPPHSPVLTMIGASMLWIGWFGFNGGSALGAGNSAGMALLVTHIAAATASLVWMFIEWFRFGRPSLVGIVTGMVAGLATVTPASGFIGVPGGLILGLAGGVACYVAVDLIRVRLKIDDSLDVFAVHGVGGILGSLLVAYLALPAFGGLGLADGVTAGSQFMVQLASVAITVLWTGIASYVILKVIGAVIGLRVDQQDEIEGLDLSQHGERGYHNG
ncbi:ammonium transporter [Alphaproteobacteria bacterium]|nr:ammonium transporter [Alphaproteobacteria bacterium]MDC0967359.1 ammonium transporter [Alphaproteobacteria bacterium]MDC1157751.1 ammonium transporter [Alphaproteobacteria bacterium]